VLGRLPSFRSSHLAKSRAIHSDVIPLPPAASTSTVHDRLG
jgi:hypothetical protein